MSYVKCQMSNVICQMSNVNKVKLLSERTSGVPLVIFSVACLMGMYINISTGSSRHMKNCPLALTLLDTKQKEKCIK